MKRKTYWVVEKKHDSSAEASFDVREDLSAAIEAAHKFFLSYGFEIKNGKPFDSGNDDGAEGGFNAFNNVTMTRGKVRQFNHCEGEGPCVRVVSGRG